MNISRNEVSEFQLASSLSSTAKPLVTALGTANNSTNLVLKITDAKFSCGGTGRLVKVYSQSEPTKGLQFDLPANSITPFSWEIPFELSVTSSTVATQGIVASAAGAGVKMAISGYIEKTA
jgi:hypothetical protein